MGFPGGSDGKESTCNVGDPGSIPGLGRSPGEGNGNSLRSSCLENSMARGAWWNTVHGFAKSQTRLSTNTVTTNAVYGNSLSKGGKAVSPAKENRQYSQHTKVCRSIMSCQNYTYIIS